MVDEINDTEEIVVKPLSKQLKSVSCFAGATIMGDGRVALILDVLGLAQQASLATESGNRALLDQKPEVAAGASERETLLLLAVGEDGRVAVPISLVARLEELSEDDVEAAGPNEVVQYRGEIMPLLRLAGVLPYRPRKERQGSLPVVVYSERGRSVGLVVDRILDIVEDTVRIQYQAKGDNLLGSAVIQDRVTDLLDIRGLVRRLGMGLDEPASN